LAFVVVKDGKASYAFYDENTAGRMLFPSSEPITLPQEINALFFGGISLAVEPCADFYVDLLKVNAKNRFVMVDPNIRPQFISNEVRYRARLTEVLGLTDVLKISDEDLLWIDPTPENLDIKIDKLLSSGPKLICLTLGGEGVNLYSQDGLIVKTLPPSVQVVDTVGAGDAFNAGFLSCLSKNKSLDKTSIAAMTDHDLQSILNFATAFASDTVTRQGSNPAWYFEE
jgi:fructokinase